MKLNTFLAKVQDEHKHTDPHLDIHLESVQIPSKVMNRGTAERLVLALLACPHGVLGMSHDIPGLVETSTNLASVKMLPDHLIEVGTSQRSSIESQKDYAVNMVTSVLIWLRQGGLSIVKDIPDGNPTPPIRPSCNLLKKRI